MVNARDARFRGTKRFQVLRRLGSGGAGVVYEVFDREQSTRVALKTLQALHANALLRFKTEFRALQELQHPNLVQLGELFDEDGWWFFTMEFVDGVDFLSWVRASSDPNDHDDGDDSLLTTLKVPLPGASAPIPKDTAKPEVGARTSFDEQRLRGALSQLTRGLLVLHAAGKVHRDIKPSNILVTAEGRVVILDFGLVLEVERDEDITQVDEVVGTVGYMAPEQAGSGAIGPPADWYGVGVVLYRALTGRLPFIGSSAEVLADKRALSPPPPQSVVAGVPDDLDALCVDLLRIDPRRRPSGVDVLRRLATSELGDDDKSTMPPARLAPFVDREQELTLLEDAFQNTRRGVASTVLVLGESGLGKSALARRFGEHAALRYGAVILTGRCHERESVRFKGVDGVVDALSRFLQKLPKDEAASIVPRRAALLPQMFPVLRRIPAIAEAPAPLREVKDPKELRNQVFSAMRELFLRLSERRPLVLVIDDLHWSDADSLALMREVMRPPDAPPLLLIATARESFAAQLPNALAGIVHRCALGRLPEAHARELAALLLQGTGAQASAASIAEEAGGHPFFIDELVRHNSATELSPSRSPSTSHSPRAVTLDEALWARIERLDHDAREIVELVAIAGVPMAQETIAAAAEIELAALSTRAWTLRIDNLVRVSGVRRGDTIEPYHDRVRAAVTANVSPETKRRWHERLARVLERSLEGTGRVDNAALALHWKGAGEPARAAAYAGVAAMQAESALAFDRAAALYRMVLDLHQRGDRRGGAPKIDRAAGVAEQPLATLDGGANAETVREMQKKLGEALANAGRGPESADAYLEAAESAPDADALDLRRLAAEQLLISGHIDRGLEVLRVVLASLDLKLPKTPKAALASLMVRRAQIRIRGLDFKERAEADVPPSVLQRIDTCFAASKTLGMVDTIRGADFQTRHLLLALDAGEPFRVLRALTLEAGFSAAAGGAQRTRTSMLVRATSDLSKRVDHPLSPVFQEGTDGLAAFLEGRWKQALTQLGTAGEFLRERAYGLTYERDTITLYSLACLVYLGELAELRRRLPVLKKEAIDRGDIYASTNLRTGLMTISELADDDVEGARREADESIAQWSHQGTHVTHFLDVQAQGQIDLYEGNPERALQRLNAIWPALSDALLLRVQYIRVTLLYLWGRAALSAAIARTGLDDDLLEEALQKAKELERESMPWATGFVHAIRAGVTFARGDRAQALVLLDAAARAFDAADMGLHAMVSRRRHGELLGGDEGAMMTRDADEWMRAQTIKDPAHMAELLVPGFTRRG